MDNKEGITPKGQFAIKFLMTYGLIISVILGFISLLASFGVFTKNEIILEKCSFGGELGCEELKVSSDLVLLSLRNNLESDMDIGSIELTSSNCSKLFDVTIPQGTA